ncbi:MAG: hypothetical protein QF872_07385, partial [Gammaproteobacteria bacterium]|nr:hypothetical protein [Gammaproteobacteria bacterium]
MNWRYYFPIATSGPGEFAFAPNSSELDGKYYGSVSPFVTTTIANADFLTAGRLEGAEYWFMTTDKSASNISYTSAQTDGDALILWQYNNFDGSYGGGAQQWANALYGKTIDVERTMSVSQIDLSPYSIIIDLRLGTGNTDISGYETFLETSGNVLYVTYSEQCCERDTNQGRLNAILAAIGGGTATFSGRDAAIDTEPIDSTYTGSGGIAEGINGYSIYCNGCGNYFNSAGNGIKLAKYLGYWGPDQTDSDTNGILVAVNDINWDHTDTDEANNYAIMQWIAGLSGSTTSSTYNLYEDQVTLAGEIYTDANFVSFTDSNKRVIAMAVIPLENFTAYGTSNDYFYPNFIPTNVWSYGDVGLNYCTAAANSPSSCAASYPLNYSYARLALNHANVILSNRFTTDGSYLPEGTSMWWQVLNPSGVGAGLWAQ